MSHKSTANWLAKLEYLLFRFVETLIRIIPLRVCYGIFNVIAWFAYYLLRKHRRRAISHVLFSGFRKTEAEAKAIVKANFRHFGKIMVEVIKAPQIVNKDNFHEYYKLEILDDEAQKFFSPPSSKNAILITGHLGNWELAGHAYQYLSGIDLVSTMRELDNKYLGEYVYSHRGHKTVSKKHGILPLFRALLSGDSVAIVADQHAHASEGVPVTFFGQLATAHKSPSYLSIRAKCPIVCGTLVRIDDNFHFKLVIMKPIYYTPTGNMDDDNKKITQLYTDSLEQLVRMYPEQWNWVHRRWLNCNRKHKASTENPAAGTPENNKP